MENNLGIVFAEDNNIDKYRVSVDLLLREIGSFSTSESETLDDWLKYVVVSDGTRISDFDLRMQDIKYIEKYFMINIRPNELLWVIASRIGGRPQ